jgi:sugar lactone lactonase YvrE
METGGVNVIDVDTNELLEPVDAHGMVAFGSAWLAGTPEGAVSRYEFDTGRVTEIEVPPPSATCDAYPISGVEGIDDSIVVGCRGLSYLSRIDVATNELAGTYRVGTTHAISVAAAGGWWAIINDQLARIDPATGTVIDVRDLQGNVPTPVHSTVATSANDLWIASERTEQVIRIPFSDLAAP